MKTLDTYEERKALVEELRQKWKALWQERIDDEVRAEGISNKDYSELFIERGTVIMATRKFKAPDFHDIVQRHLAANQIYLNNVLPLNPSRGGWGKFVKTSIISPYSSRRRKHAPNDKCLDQQRKKSGRGWLHLKV